MRLLRKKRIALLLILLILGVLFAKSDWLGRLMYPIHYKDDIRASARGHGVDPHLVAAVIRTESNYKTGLESPKGAVGIMQIMPDTADWIIRQAGYTDITLRDVMERPDVGIELGTWYLKSLHEQFDGNAVAALAAYNAGPGNVRGWLRSGEWDGREETASRIPFGETRHYVQRVIYYYNKYKSLYPSL